MKKRNDFIPIFFWYSLHQDTSKLDVINLKNKKGKGKEKREKCDIYAIVNVFNRRGGGEGGKCEKNDVALN